MLSDIEVYDIMDFDACPIFESDILTKDPKVQDITGNTILHQYVCYHDFDSEIMQSFMNRGADLEIRNNSGKTAFLLAVVHRQREMIEYFIEHGANVHIQDNLGNNALHYMALREVNLHFETLKEDEDEEEEFNFDDTFTILERLLNLGIEVNLPNRDYETPLMLAARGKYLGIVKLLLAFGANVHLRNENLKTCLHLASTYNRRDSMKLDLWNERNCAIISELSRNGACINCFDNKGRTALGYILLSGHDNRVYFARELIKMAALVNWRRKIDFYLGAKRILGRNKRDLPMTSYVKECCEEIDRMKTFQITKRSNLCQIALKGVSSAERINLSEIRDKLLTILLLNTFPVYQDFIVSNFELSYLREKISELVIYTRKDGKEISLSSYVIREISSFLEGRDIFNVISAFRKFFT